MVNKDCLVTYALSFILGVISIIFIVMNNNLQIELNEKNIIKTYKLKANETMSNIIQIRKNDGSSCNISTIYEDGKKVINKNGDACL